MDNVVRLGVVIADAAIVASSILVSQLEEGIFSTRPAVMLIVTSPLFVAYYSARPQIAKADGQLSAKMTAGIMLIILEIIATALRITASGEVATSIRSHLLACVAAVASTVLLHYEHLYAITTSALISIYLFVSILQDLAKARSFFSPNGARHSSLGCAFMAIMLAKLVIVALGEVPRCHDASPGQKSTSGFWTRSVLACLSSTILFGFGNRQSVDDLPSLGVGYSSEVLAQIIEPNWERYRGRPHRLAKTLLRSLIWRFAIIIPIRLLHLGCYLSQPFIMQEILIYLNNKTHSIEYRNGLVCVFILTNLGAMMFGRLFEVLNYKLAFRARGMLMSQIIRKNIVLSGNGPNKSSAIAPIIACVDNFASGILGIHLAWSNTAKFSISLYFLTNIVGRVALLLLIPAFIANVGLLWIGGKRPKANMLLHRATASRVSKTSNILSRMKGIKMMGIESQVADFVQRLRVAEVSESQNVSILHVAVYGFGLHAHSVMHILLPGSLALSTMTQSLLESTSVWIVLAFVDLIMSSTYRLFRHWHGIGSLGAACRNIEAFLHSEEMQDSRINDPTRSMHRHAPMEHFPVQFFDANIAPLGSDYARVLVNAAIERSTLTMVVGPEGSGKTLLLQAVLGEVNIIHGSVYVEQQNIAYCSQESWIKDTTIRENIIGENPYDEAWFNTVVDVCLLRELDELSLAGAGGSRLTKGQAQQIVVARAVYSQTKLIVIDDILSAVDRATASLILDQLFGADGLLRRLGTTVIMAAHTTDILDMADALLILSWDGIAKLERSKSAISIYAASHPYLGDDEISDEGAEEFESTRPSRRETAKPEISATLFPKWGVLFHSFFFYLGSFKTHTLLLAMVLLAAATSLERIPDYVLRIWVEGQSDDEYWRTVYTTLQALYWVGTIAWLWIFHMHVVPMSAKGLHKTLIDTVAHSTVSLLPFTESEAILNHFTKHMELIRGSMPTVLSLSLYTFVLAMSELVMVSATSPRFAPTIVSFILTVLLLLHLFYSRTNKQMHYIDKAAKEQFSAFLNETSDGAQHVRSFGWEAKVLKRGLTLLDNSQRSFYYMDYKEFWLGLVLEACVLAVSVALVCLATDGGPVIHAAMGPALIVTSQAASVLQHVLQDWAILDKSLGSFSELHSFVRGTALEDSGCATLATVPENWPHTGEIEFTDVNSEYVTPSGGQTGVRNLSIGIEGGTKVGILGASGSGKTSLLLTLLNFLPYTGQITIDGIEISTVPRHFLRSRITSISQDLMQLPCSVRDNMAPWDMGKPMEDRTDDATILQALGQVGLSGHIMRRGGLGAELSDFGLTHAQQQLFALARAVLHKRQTNSKILLIDEPLEGLDSETEDRIQSVMADVFEDCTVLNIANRLSSMDAADVLLEMSGGYLVPDGWGN